MNKGVGIIIFLYGLLAWAFIRSYSYKCYGGIYGIRHYTFLSIIMGLFFPITILISWIRSLK